MARFSIYDTSTPAIVSPQGQVHWPAIILVEDHRRQASPSRFLSLFHLLHRYIAYSAALRHVFQPLLSVNTVRFSGNERCQYRQRLLLFSSCFQISLSRVQCPLVPEKIRAHCPAAKVLELYPLSSVRVLEDADSWLEVAADLPERLAEHVNALAAPQKPRMRQRTG